MISKQSYNRWLLVSIFTAILYSFSGLRLAFASAYTVQDDARQHVFWLLRLNDPNLFPGDAIADYFSSVVPGGYKLVYWLANSLGLEPFLFNKILPILLGVGTTVFLFAIALEIFPVPLAGFLASLLLNQNLWMLDDLVSGTPRAFFYVLFLGFIYYLLRQNLLLCCLFIGLQGFFYPQVLLISTGILCLNLLSKQPKKNFYLVGLIVALAIVALYQIQTGDMHQVISLAVAKQLPEFYPGGRNTFFLDNPWAFWLVGQRSGYFPREWQYVLLCSFGFCLPVLARFPTIFPLVKQIKPQVKIVGQIWLASLGLFLLAHLLLFKLHLPSRYSQHTWKIIIALVDGITLTIIIDRLGRYQQQLRPLIIAIALAILLYPTYAVQSYPYRLGYVTGESPKLYQFLQQQPSDVLIASLSSEADFIPSLARRSVLVAQEYSIPYHWDYYQLLRQKTRDLIKAQYSTSQAEIKQIIEQYQIDLWLIEQNAFDSNYLPHNPWLKQFQPITDQAIATLAQNQQPIMLTQSDRCSIFRTDKLNLLDAQCLTLPSPQVLNPPSHTIFPSLEAR